MAYQKPDNIKCHKMRKQEGDLWVRREASLGVGEGVSAHIGQKISFIWEIIKNKKNELKKAETSVYVQYRHNDSFTAFISLLNLPTRDPWIWGCDDFTPFSGIEMKRLALIILYLFLLLRGKSWSSWVRINFTPLHRRNVRAASRTTQPRH